MKGWVKRQAEWRREEQDKCWLEEILVFERAMIMQKRIVELIIEGAEEKARAGRYNFGLGVWGMQKEGFGFVWKGSWLAFVERIVFRTVRLRSIIWEAHNKESTFGSFLL